MPEGDNPVGSLGHRKIWALHDLEREALVLEHGARATEGKMDGSQRLTLNSSEFCLESCLYPRNGNIMIHSPPRATVPLFQRVLTLVRLPGCLVVRIPGFHCCGEFSPCLGN